MPSSQKEEQIRKRGAKRHKNKDASGVSKSAIQKPEEAKDVSGNNKYQPTECPPPHWEEVLALLTRYRSSADGKAPVDIMGIEAMDAQWATQCDENVRRFRTLVGLMLSSQTKDEVTSATVHDLVAHAGGCTPAAIAALTVQRLNEHIARVGFHNRKAEYIHATACRIQADFGGRVPGDLQTLLSFPGVGPKMALLFQQSCDDVVHGISVDVHMHRIFRRWAWTSAECRQPEHTRQGLEAWLPRAHWSTINPLVVGFGQRICTAQRPKCDICPIAHLCPTFALTSKPPSSVANPKGTRKSTTTDIEDLGILHRKMVKHQTLKSPRPGKSKKRSRESSKETK